MAGPYVTTYRPLDPLISGAGVVVTPWVPAQLSDAVEYAFRPIISPTHIEPAPWAPMQWRSYLLGTALEQGGGTPIPGDGGDWKGQIYPRGVLVR